MIQIEVKSVNIIGDIRYSYCQVEDIPAHFTQLHTEGRTVVATKLADEFGRLLDIDGQLV